MNKSNRLPSTTWTLAALTVLATTAAPARADDAPPTDGRWRGDASVAFSASSGTTDNTALLLKADLGRVTPTDRISLGGSVDYARSTADDVTETTTDKAGAFGQYDYNLGPRWFAFGRLALDRDAVAELDLRRTLGAGLGWKVVDTQALRFTLFGGAGHTTDKYNEPQTLGGVTDTRFSRANLLLAEESVHALSKTVQVKQRLEVLPAISGDKSTLAKFSADLSVAMNDTIRLTVGLIDRYQSEPPAGQKSNEVSVFTGLSFRLGEH